MAKALYRVTFDDGSVHEGDYDTADQAKIDARNQRIRKIDPGGSRNAADRNVDARVKVKSVEEVGASDRGGRDRERDRDRERSDRDRLSLDDRTRQSLETRADGERSDRERREQADRERDERERAERDRQAGGRGPGTDY